MSKSKKSAIELLDFDNTWSNIIYEKGILKLKQFLENINFSNNESLFENTLYIDIYSSCYYLCIQSNVNCEKIYEKYNETLIEFLNECIKKDFEDNITDNYTYLEKFIKNYEKYYIFSKWLRNFFVFVDKLYMNNNTKKSLEYVGDLAYKNVFINNIKNNIIIKNLLNIINEYRSDKKPIDTNLFRSSLNIYMNMEYIFPGLYENDFVKPYIENTNQYYTLVVNNILQIYSVPDYLIKIDNILNIESEISSKYLPYLNNLVKTPLFNLLDKLLIEQNIECLIINENSGLFTMLKNKMFNNISLMYTLFKRTETGLNILLEHFKKYVVNCGNVVINNRISRIENKTITDNYDDPEFVKEFIELYDNMSNIVKNAFFDNPTFVKGLARSFVDVINIKVKDINSADLLAYYSDKLLKTGGEKMEESEIENNLNKISILFDFLIDKDIFEETYRNLLSKRILNQRMSNNDLEKFIISKMKIICGSQFTFKLEGMINDLAICLDETNNFQKFISDNDVNLNGIDFSVQIFSNGYWPLMKSINVILPKIMQNCIDKFTSFYYNKMNSHKITWQYGNGNVFIKSTFKGKSYEIQVTTLQAIVLMAFNPFNNIADNGVRDFQTLVSVTDLSEDILKRVLHSLSCGKFKVIKKLDSPDSTDKIIKNTDIFQFNSGFSCPTRKFRIPMASLEDARSSEKTIEENRVFMIDASIVRIMKSRKTLKHNSLVAEVMSQLFTFRPDIKQIKKRIESLIEREYLERDNSDNSTYNYLA